MQHAIKMLINQPRKLTCSSARLSTRQSIHTSSFSSQKQLTSIAIGQQSDARGTETPKTQLKINPCCKLCVLNLMLNIGFCFICFCFFACLFLVGVLWGFETRHISALYLYPLLHITFCEGVSNCVCVCVCVCVCEWVSEWVRACLRECVRACMRACVRACVREWVFVFLSFFFKSHKKDSM